MTDAARRFLYAVILPGSGVPRALLQPAEGGWALPHWETDEQQNSSAAAHVNRTVRERVGAAVTTLRCLPHNPKPADGLVRRIYELELHDPAWHPPADWRWVTPPDLDRLPWSILEHRDAVARWFAEAAPGTIPLRRVPWATPGWFAAAGAWCREQIETLGLQLTGPIEQERTWCISCILRAPARGRDLFLKASPSFFAQETPIMRYLAGRFPRHVPEVVASDDDRAWLLMRDFGRIRLGRIPDISWWEEAVRLLARLQLASLDHVDEMLAAGFLDRRLDVLASQIDPMFDHVLSTGRTARGALSDTELDTLVRSASRLRQMCADLAALPVPSTLEHGDFHAGNVALADDRLVIFDWSDGCVAHPFFALLPFLTFWTPPDVPGVSERLIAAYLNAWSGFGRPEQLRAAFDLSQVLAALHQAVSYHRILTNVEDEAVWEWESELPFFLRRVLDGLG